MMMSLKNHIIITPQQTPHTLGPPFPPFKDAITIWKYYSPCF
jgi:hypothetical protein